MSERTSILVNSNRTPLFINNPYVLIVGDESENNLYFIPPDLIAKAVEIDKMTCSVRIVCFFDCVISFYYLIFGYIYAFIFFVVSIGGYLSTVNHRKSLMCCYVFYQYFQVLGRFLIFTYWLQEINKFNSQDSTRGKNNETVYMDRYLRGDSRTGPLSARLRP